MTLAPSVKTNATFIGCASPAAAADSVTEKAHDKSNNNRRDPAVGIGFDRLPFICHLRFIWFAERIDPVMDAAAMTLFRQDLGPCDAIKSKNRNRDWLHQMKRWSKIDLTIAIKKPKSSKV